MVIICHLVFWIQTWRWHHGYLSLIPSFCWSFLQSDVVFHRAYSLFLKNFL
jgi:hypothetical protein